MKSISLLCISTHYLQLKEVVQFKRTWKVQEYFILRHIHAQKGATKRRGAIKKNLPQVKNISFWGISICKKGLIEELKSISHKSGNRRLIHQLHIQYVSLATFIEGLHFTFLWTNYQCQCLVNMLICYY